MSTPLEELNRDLRLIVSVVESAVARNNSRASCAVSQDARVRTAIMEKLNALGMKSKLELVRDDRVFWTVVVSAPYPPEFSKLDFDRQAYLTEHGIALS